MIIKKAYKSLRKVIIRIHSLCELHGVSKGKNNNVFGHIDIVESKRFSIGNGCSFNHGCYVHAGNGVIFGDDVTMSAHSSVISMGIDYKDWVLGNKRHTTSGKVSIGNHVWIGANAIILPGVTISGEYVVIAANSVVTKDICESKCIFAGNPARLLRYF